MLLSIFIFLVVFSLALIIGGRYVDAPVMQIAGTAVLFIVGILLLLSNIEYSSGFSESTTYSYVSGNISNTSTTQALSYSTWDEEDILGIKTRHTVAVLLMASSIFIFLSILSQLREGLPDER